MIDLCLPNGDIALHINPRFKFFETTTVLNSYTYGMWQKTDIFYPLVNERPFKIRIVCMEKHFKVGAIDKVVMMILDIFILYVLLLNYRNEFTAKLTVSTRVVFFFLFDKGGKVYFLT